MLDFFSTREQATIIFLMLFLICALSHKQIRIEAYKIIKIACNPKLMSPAIIMIIYGCCFVFVFQKMKFFEWKLLKDIVMWFVLAGIPMCYKAVSIKYEDQYFKKIIFDNIKFLIVVEFFVSTFTFNLIIELIMQVVLFVLVITQGMTKNNEKDKEVHKIVSSLISAIGIVIICSSVNIAIKQYNELEVSDILISFFIPIILTILYLPISYFMVIVSKYKMIFMRMGFRELKRTKVKFKDKIVVIFICKLSFKKLTLFDRHAIQGIYMRFDSPHFKEVVKIFKEKLRGGELNE